MEHNSIMQGVFFLYLMTASIQDIKTKQIKIWVFFLFGALALVSDGYMWMAASENFLWKSHLASCSLGLGMLGLGKISRGAVGTGDGLFFLISGLMLNFGENLFVLCGGILLCGICGMAIFVWKWISAGEKSGKRTLPFLPFAAIPGICLTVIRIF